MTFSCPVVGGFTIISNLQTVLDARRIENGLEPAYDAKKISGFAFGMGVERIAMMKYGVGDIGQFYSGDMRFLSQFA